MLEAELEEPIAPRRAAVGVGVDDQLGAAVQGRVRGRVHVAEDHVGLQALLERPVGAAVDADDERADVADVGAQRLDVAPVAVAADDDQDLAVAEAGPGRRELDRAGQQVGLAAHVGDRVLGEFGQRLVDPLALLVELALELDRAEHGSPEHGLAPHAHGPRLDPQPVTVAEQLEGVASSTSSSRIPARARSSGPAFG